MSHIHQVVGSEASQQGTVGCHICIPHRRRNTSSRAIQLKMTQTMQPALATRLRVCLLMLLGDRMTRRISSRIRWLGQNLMCRPSLQPTCGEPCQDFIGKLCYVKVVTGWWGISPAMRRLQVSTASFCLVDVVCINEMCQVNLSSSE